MSTHCITLCYAITINYCLLVDVEEGDTQLGSSTSSAIAERDAYLHIDMCKIDQVIRNLVTNAVIIS